uniref:Uncharacterized protein n=1 Tax=Lepeophtheirus salmonis TaxID=72036 RepID=A0A0K2TRY9_LEPSM
MAMASKILLYANEACNIPEGQRADFIKVASKLYDTQASLIINQKFESNKNNISSYFSTGLKKSLFVYHGQFMVPIYVL